jgi:Tir chaperone protein (CesT) family
MPEIREHADLLLKLVAEALPIEVGDSEDEILAWDEGNQCALTFDETLGVILTLDEVVDAMFLIWVLGDLPEEAEDRADAMSEMLEANHEWRETEGGALGIDSNTGMVTLSYRVDLPLDDPSVIQDIIVKLYNIGLYWQKTLELSYRKDESVEVHKMTVRESLG